MRRKTLFKRIGLCMLTSLFLFSQMPASVFAEDPPVKYTPFDFQTSGTGGATTVEQAKENLEIPNVVQDLGDSETDVMSQDAVTRAIQAAAGQEDTVPLKSGLQSSVEDPGSPYLPFSIKTGGTGANNLKQAKMNLEIPEVVQETGDSFIDVMSQKAVTEAIQNALNGSNEPIEPWQPNPTWFDIEDVITNDNSGYTKKYILLLPDSSLTTTLFFTTVVKPSQMKTSDGAIYNIPINSTGLTHTWDAALDKPCDEGYKTRWVMVYYDNSFDNVATPIDLEIPAETMYMVIDNIKFGTSVYFGGFKGKRLLQNFKLINGSNLHSSVTYIYGMFQGCVSLTTIPLLDTSNVINMAWMFQDCYSLTTIPLLDTSNVTTMQDMFSGCASLTTIPLLDTSKVIDMTSMFYGCASLKTIPLLDTSNVGEFMWNGLMSSMFHNCYSLVLLNLQNAKVSFSLSLSPYLNKTSLLNILNGLVDLTGQYSQTLYLDTPNLAKLDLTEIAIATAKNWNLA